MEASREQRRVSALDERAGRGQGEGHGGGEEGAVAGVAGGQLDLTTSLFHVTLHWGHWGKGRLPRPVQGIVHHRGRA